MSVSSPSPISTTPWLTVAEAASYARMTVPAIRSAEKRGQIHAHRSQTGRLRFLRSDVDRFLGGTS